MAQTAGMIDRGIGGDAATSIRITLVISSLERGGAERVMSMLASAWAEQGQNVTLLSLAAAHEPAYPVHSSVKIQHLGISSQSRSAAHAIFQNLARIRILRRAIRAAKPDVVVSFMDTVNVLTVIATRVLNVPTVICEHIDPSLYDIGPAWSRLRKLVYPFADELICLTESTLSRFQRMIRVKGRVIPDLIATPPAREANQDGSFEKAVTGGIIVGMGRLVPQKGFDLLLEAFARIAGSHPRWRLEIVGGGPLRQELERKAQTLNIAGRVHFTGEVCDPFRILSNADIFVFSSRFEGFGLALCEAMACGLPVISFDCPSGPGDIIRHGVDGILVPAQDLAALSDAMDRLMSNPEERGRLAARAPEVLVRFGKERILSLWRQLFHDLLFSLGSTG